MSDPTHRFDVAVIGAGFAGMAAALALARRGKCVALIEKRHTLGGRVHSTTDAQTGDILDNGPHLFVGAYHSAKAVLEELGTLDQMLFQPRCDIHLRDEDGDVVFRHRNLPGDLGLAAGFAGMRGVSLGDVWATRRLLPAARNADLSELDRISCTEWYDSLGVPKSVRRLFLDPITIASLNDHPDRSSAALMARVLALTFSGDPGDGGLGFILGPHSALFEEALDSRIEANGGKVMRGRRAERVLIEDGRARGVLLNHGFEIEADDVIVAVPHRQVPTLFEQERQELIDIASLGAVPIVNIHLWLDRPVIDKPLVGMVGKQTQWVFALDHLWPHPGQPHRIIGVISGARDEAMISHQGLVDQMMKDLTDLYPAARGAEVNRAVVINEKFATMAPAPGAQAKRPGPRSPWPNVWWAGDWTDTGLPSTIEGACRSGHACAEAVLSGD